MESRRLWRSVTRKRVKILRLFLLEEANSRKHAKRRKINKELEKGETGLVNTQTPTSKHKILRT